MFSAQAPWAPSFRRIPALYKTSLLLLLLYIGCQNKNKLTYFVVLWYEFNTYYVHIVKTVSPCDNGMRTRELHQQLAVLFPLIIPDHILPCAEMQSVKKNNICIFVLFFTIYNVVWHTLYSAVGPYHTIVYQTKQNKCQIHDLLYMR